ncbi:MAG TPA: thiol reductant ABC exporter subunit CydC [Marinobacter sp.]|nr:thiol reductant ABC exporter subunit CydC [Marinobacter sp.]
MMHELKPWLALIFQRPGRLVAGALLLLVTLISGIGLLALSGWFITQTALAGLLLAAGLQAAINLYVPGGGIRFFAVSRTLGRYMERVYNHDTVLRLLTDIRVALFRRLSGSPSVSRHQLTGAQWLSRLTNDVDALDTLYLRLIAPTALAVLITALALLLVGIIFNNAIAFGLILLFSIALVLATIGTYLSTRKTVWDQSDRLELLRSAVIEHLEGFPELTAAGQTSKHTAWLMHQASQHTSAQVKADSRVGYYQAGSTLLINLAVVFVLWVGFYLFEDDIVSGPLLVLLPIALLGLAEVYSPLPEAFGKLGATQASAQRLNLSESAPRSNAEKVKLSEELALVVSELSIQHGNQPPLFEQVNILLRKGDKLGIVGPSGSGKSSLSDALAGLIEPSHGTIAIDRFAYLTQQTVLFEDSLRNNLLLGKPEASDDELWQILQLVEMRERFASEPDQLDTWLSNAGSRLSGGEARRVALARVLLSPAPVLILDEPFTGVDATTRDLIKQRIAKWLTGQTIISLAHSPEALPGTDRIIYLPA